VELESAHNMKFQIGKQGITEGVIVSLKNAFKTHKSVRISVLQNQAPSKDKVRGIAEELCLKLEGNYVFTLIGFTIILRKTK